MDEISRTDVSASASKPAESGASKKPQPIGMSGSNSLNVSGSSLSSTSSSVSFDDMLTNVLANRSRQSSHSSGGSGRIRRQRSRESSSAYSSGTPHRVRSSHSQQSVDASPVASPLPSVGEEHLRGSGKKHTHQGSNRKDLSSADGDATGCGDSGQASSSGADKKGSSNASSSAFLELFHSVVNDASTSVLRTVSAAEIGSGAEGEADAKRKIAQIFRKALYRLLDVERARVREYLATEKRRLLDRVHGLQEELNHVIGELKDARVENEQLRTEVRHGREEVERHQAYQERLCEAHKAVMASNEYLLNEVGTLKARRISEAAQYRNAFNDLHSTIQTFTGAAQLHAEVEREFGIATGPASPNTESNA